MLKRIAVVVVALFAGIQFILPERTNPPVREEKALPMHPVFRRACADCHSNETRWPWYSYVAPASWLVAGHVNHARRHLNVSEWTGLEARRAAHKLDELCEQVREGSMPLPSYLLLHRDAKLSGEDRDSLCAWASRERAAIVE